MDTQTIATGEWNGLLWLAAGAVVVVLAALALYAVNLHRRLREAERRLRDLSLRSRSSEASLRRASSLDALTGVANRRVFDETLIREWERAHRAQKTISLLMVDIDHFKRHNDQHGHQAGDECLKRVAGVLASQARRGGDLVARYGGEEFAVLLPEASETGAAVVAERLRVSVAALVLPYQPPGAGHAVTVSIGVASLLPKPDIQPAELVSAADRALYTAKAVGRNQVIVASVLNAV